MRRLFTERHGGAKPRTAEQLDVTTRDALLNLLASRIEQEWFGHAFPDKCPDGYAHAGTDHARLRRALSGFGLPWPADALQKADTADESGPLADGLAFDLIEFSYEHIAQPDDGSFHNYFGHMHYGYDQAAGQHRFAEDVNRLFERNGMAFELRDGEVLRLAPTGLQEALASATFNTGDAHLDEMLEDARTKILSRDPKVRRESLEELWDAWERLKTLEPGVNKPAKAKALLDKAAVEPTFRQLLEIEARALTDIGNTFMIRHTETDKIPITDSVQVDYLFHRMFALLRLLLKVSRRGA